MEIPKKQDKCLKCGASGEDLVLYQIAGTPDLYCSGCLTLKSRIKTSRDQAVEYRKKITELERLTPEDVKILNDLIM
jgi:hypothetical protein